ncbi:MAG TPA: heavy metal-binding domain-containing protein [Ignavibacteria bacterium]
MHPEVISDKPGQCPKCGMDLVPQKKEEKDQGMNCPDMKQCKKIGCNMNQCKGQSGGCTDKCPVIKNEKSKEHDHNSNGHQHKSGCQKKGC